MVSEHPVVVPPRSREELQQEFRAAQRRRLVTRGVVFWRDTDLPDEGPRWVEAPPPEKVD